MRHDRTQAEIEEMETAQDLRDDEELEADRSGLRRARELPLFDREGET